MSDLLLQPLCHLHPKIFCHQCRCLCQYQSKILAFLDSTLCVVDDFTREALAVMPDFSISGVRLARELDAIIARRGKPKTIVSDNVLHSDTQASFGRRSSSRIFQIRALKSIAGWASATMEELSAIANTGSMRSVVAGPHRP